MTDVNQENDNSRSRFRDDGLVGATNVLFRGITATMLGDEMGVSKQRIVQARMSPDLKGKRPAPKRWREAVIKLAQERIIELQALIAKLTDANQ